MNTLPTHLIAQTFVTDRALRYQGAATSRRLVRRALRERSHAGRDPDHVAAADHHVAASHLVAVSATNGTTRPTGTASSPTASLPVDRVA